MASTPTQSRPISTTSPSLPPPPQPTHPLNFFDLPTELRLKIYRHLLPHGQTIEISPRTIRPYYTPMGSPQSRIQHRLIQRPPDLQHARNVLGTCRRFRDEAADVLYGENVFRFVLSRDALGYKTVGNSFLWLPTSVLRLIWKCEVVIREELHRPEIYRRVRRWLAHTVARLGEGHALRELRVSIQNGDFVQTAPRMFSIQNLRLQAFEPWEGEEEERAKGFQFVVEPLAGLRGVRKVSITGHVEEGLAKAVGEVMGMKVGWGGIGKREYACRNVLRKKRHAIKKTRMMVSTKRFWQPELDWGVVGDEEMGGGQVMVGG
ncbi:hypothetical protein K432DRAFT_352207 [Lepidopterella palustris CBS 459.81]|uniref:DUF7730 domain-containing protein n=1 Tax=Lepidopterella palustris CBS 459.81 TaxID=1314670 RepID=A0A8E2EBB9_9PEZI|nr:hypothetical protein K432DRAFT_352207 [Lepidopterella palustris CBS 459.81]